MDRLEAMAVFVMVADLKGFAPAARRMSLSPSAVTRLVAALEEHLDARLLQRTTRSVRLTDVGARYLERARRILGDVAEAEAATQSERSVPSGRFVLAAPSVFGRMHVAPLMRDFIAKYPAIQCELTLGNRMANLVEEGIDAAVRIGALDDSSLIVRQVGATRRVLLGAPEYFKRHKRPRSPEDLKRHDIIQFTALMPTTEWRFFHEGKERSVTITPRYVTNNADAAILQAEAGGGLVMLLSYQVADAVRARRLELVLPGFEPPRRPIQIVYPTTRLLSAKVRVFVELVTETCDWRFIDL